MHVDGVSLLTPSLAGVFKVANQFLFLGIDTDDWVA
jgi:hypothetical protein